MDPLSRTALLPLVRAALREDAAAHDATSRAVIPPDLRIRARIAAKARGVLAGVKLAALVFETQDRSLRCRLLRRSGASLSSGTPILDIDGPARSIFAAERTALNFLMHLSGIATLTRAYVDKTQGTGAAILDTRKTIPGLRALEKYAVAAGGGANHRHDLSDAILIKTNHLNALRQETRDARHGIQEAVKQAGTRFPRLTVQVEVSSLRELREALQAKPDAILLDNFSLADIRHAVAMSRVSRLPSRSRRPLLEVSGGVTLENVRAIARTGVDRISIGRLTHSAPALDVNLTVV